jgi:hypothetical protein
LDLAAVAVVPDLFHHRPGDLVVAVAIMAAVLVVAPALAQMLAVVSFLFVTTAQCCLLPAHLGRYPAIGTTITIE